MQHSTISHLKYQMRHENMKARNSENFYSQSTYCWNRRMFHKLQADGIRRKKNEVDNCVWN